MRPDRAERLKGWAGWFAFVAVCALLLAIGSSARTTDGREVLVQPWEAAVDRSGALDIDAARALPFSPLPGSPALGYVDAAVWLRHTLQPSSTRAGARLLELQLPAIDEATLYWPTASGGFHTSTAGDMLPLAARAVRHRNVVFRVDVPADREVTFYLRVAGTNNQTFSVVLWSPDTFFGAALDDQLLWGALFALHAVLLLSNLWLFQATRDAQTGWFVAFICVSFGAIAFNEGFGYLYLFDAHPMLNHRLLAVFWMLSVPITYAFLFSYAGLFRPPRRWPAAVVCAIAALSFAALLLDLTVSPGWVRPLFSQLQLVSTMALFVLLVWLDRNGGDSARLLLVAMLPTLVTIGLKMARNLGWLAPNAWIDSAYFFGLAAYLLVLNYGITRRYQALRLAKENAQSQALALAQRNERELEQLVNQRTEEIAAAMRRVQQALDLERRLIGAQRDLYATVSHELRTPVTVIDLTLQNLMRQQVGKDPAMLTRLRKIVEATDRLSRLLDRYLKQDRLSADGSGPAMKWADTDELLDDARAAAQLYSSAHRLSISAASEVRAVWCDPMLTRLALNNLAENAVKYTPAGTSIVVEARQEASGGRTSVVLEVRDKGPGMTQAEMQRVFDPGYRGRQSSFSQGSGMGLSLARHVVEQQGGTLTLRSSPGEGTTGTISLPQTPSSPPVQHPLDTGQPEAADLRHKGIDRA